MNDAQRANDAEIMRILGKLEATLEGFKEHLVTQGKVMLSLEKRVRRNESAITRWAGGAVVVAVMLSVAVKRFFE